MDSIILIIANSICNMIAFWIGAKVAYNNRKNDKSFSQAIKEKKDEKIKAEENKAIETMLFNIENYDGTAIGQKDIP